MKRSSIQAIFHSLRDADVRYLVVGGLAVNAHGYLRFTLDLDIVVQLTAENIGRAFQALAGIGYKPRLPITAEQFADADLRDDWVKNKNMQVLQLWSGNHPETCIDIFAFEPFTFDEEYQKALIKRLDDQTEVRFVNLDTLIGMKEIAGRKKDRIDIEYLQMRRADEGK